MMETERFNTQARFCRSAPERTAVRVGRSPSNPWLLTVSVADFIARGGTPRPRSSAKTPSPENLAEWNAKALRGKSDVRLSPWAS